jgi:hypothetical protein
VFEQNHLTKKPVRREATEAHFVLKCNGTKYPLSFEVMNDWFIHPDYKRAADYQYGTDIAFAVVKVMKDNTKEGNKKI